MSDFSLRCVYWQCRLPVLLIGLSLIGLTSFSTPDPVTAQVVGPTFQIVTIAEHRTRGQENYLTFSVEAPEAESCPSGERCGPPRLLPYAGSMTASLSNFVVTPGAGMIGGDVFEFDVTMTNTSSDPQAILTAFAFQSKFSESPALASRLGDKLFSASLVSGAATGKMTSVKKNGVSNGLFSGKWKGICINSSTDFLPEFNAGLTNESLECAGNRADTNFDGEPDLQFGANMLGLRPGESQTVRLRLDSGTTDGALHVVQPGTLRGRVVGSLVVGPHGVTYFAPTIDNTGIANPNVLAIIEFGDNKALRRADSLFDPTFAPSADDYTFVNQRFLTLPRVNFAFTDILGRNHTCAMYGLSHGACRAEAGASPRIGLLGSGDLVVGVENFAALLQGFGEFHDPNHDFLPDRNPADDAGAGTRPTFPYGVLCKNCGGRPFTPIAEFYKDNGDGTLTRQIAAGRFGALGGVAQYTVVIAPTSPADEFMQEIIPEPDPGRPRPGPALGTSATGEFHSLTVAPGAGVNGGDVIEFTIDIQNTSTNPDAYLTAFNYQTKERGLADISTLDGFTQDRRDIRLDSSLTPCTSLSQGACWNASLGIGHFPNVIGNGLLFAQMVWSDANAGREPDPVNSDQVFVAPNGINPIPYRLESVKKNGPFTPIFRGNKNFVCIKSGLFDPDPDADAACAGQPAMLIDPDKPPSPANIFTNDPANPSGRLGLRPGERQSVRIRMEFGDFRGALVKIEAGTLGASNVDTRYRATSGLARFFDCTDQRELEFCHPHLVDAKIGYLPNTHARWMTPATLESIQYVIINQPGNAPTLMNFQQNFGVLLAMAGFVPSAEFYAPDTNPVLVGTPDTGTLIRQQVLGAYKITTPAPPAPVAP
jgi:hypothetical protein